MIFQSVVGYEGLYSVSTEGDIKNDLTGQILKPNVSHNGVRVALYRNGENKVFPVRMLVLKTFVGAPPPNHWPVNLDGDLENNVLTNLAYIPRATIARRKMTGSTKLTVSEVEEINTLLSQGVKPFEIAVTFGVDISTIYRLRENKDEQSS